jgi:hypothetical protein
MTTGFSPIRMKKVLEGRMVWNSLVGTYNEKLHDFFKYRYTSDDGFSKKEMALIIFPDRTAPTKKGGEKPSMVAIRYVEHALADFRKWLLNQSLILVCEKLLSGEWLLYNVQKRKAVDRYEVGGKKVITGINDNIIKANKIHSLGRKQRIQKAEALSIAIQLKAKRKRKKSGGEYE